MKLRLRSRLFLVSIGLIGAVGAPTGVFLETQLRRVLTEQIERSLRHEAAMASVALTRLGPAPSPSMVDELTDALGAAADVRVTVVAPDGRVLGDSNLTLAAVREVERHNRRPEVVAALETGSGRSARYSTTIGTDLLYVAVALDNGGVVRVATPLSAVDQRVGLLRVALLLSAGLALMIAVIISALASHVTIRPMLSLVERARSLSGSMAPEASDRATHDELGYVAGSLERLAGELNASVSALAAERDLREAVLSTMGEGILAMDEELRVQWLNPACRALLDMEGRAEGRVLEELSPMPDLIDLAQSGLYEDVAGELQFGKPPRTLAVSGTPLRATRGVLLVLRDVTEVRRLEAVRRDFIANISHELRTPVSVIRANSETLLAGAIDDPKQGRVFADASLRHAERLSNLLSDLLDLSRLEADAYRLNLTWLSVDETLESALREVAQLAERRSIELSLKRPVGGVVLADTQAITQVLVNLLVNAVKYTPEGGHVEVCAQLRGERVRVEVRDDGPGVERKHRARLFERFYRADEGRSREMGGTGLGLAIVKHLVNNMGGDVGMEPNDPHGCCFWFSLPGAKQAPG